MNQLMLILKIFVYAFRQTFLRHRTGCGYGGVYRFYSKEYSNLQSLDIDLSNEESKRRLYNRFLLFDHNFVRFDFGLWNFNSGDSNANTELFFFS